MSKDTGGPAFPRPSYGPNEPADGMTLRDYFAAKALSKVMDRWPDGHPDGWSGIARHAYFIADAMLAERNKA